MVTLMKAVLFVMVSFVSARDVPDFLKVCKRQDPDLPNCVSESIDHLRPLLVDGVAEYGIPALEPLLLHEIVVSQAGGLKIAGNNIKVHGCSNFAVTHLSIELSTIDVEVTIELPNLWIEGTYSVEGKLLLLPVVGSGPLQINLTLCKGEVKMRGNVFKDDNGVEHLSCAEMDLKISVGSGVVRLDHLLGKDDAFGALVNSAINKHFDTFLKEIKPLLEEALSEAFKDIANKIVEPFNYAQLLLND